MDGYFWLPLDESVSVVGMCHHCIDNCVKCSDENTCDICIDEYYLNQEVGNALLGSHIVLCHLMINQMD